MKIPMVNQDKLVPMMNIDLLALVHVNVCFEESFATILKTSLVIPIHFIF